MITIDAIHKPVRAVATATVHLTVDGPRPYGDIIEAAVVALGETKRSLFGYGLRDEEGAHVDSEDVHLMDGSFIFYGYRD